MDKNDLVDFSDIAEVLKKKEFKQKKIRKKLKNISKDATTQEIMCDSDSFAIDFDEVMRKYCGDLGRDTLRSVDSIFSVSPKNKSDSHSKALIFLEFKNGRIADKKNMTGKEVESFGKTKEIREIEQKIKDSLLVFCDIAGWTISNTRQRVNFILVYDKDKNSSRNEIKEHFSKKGGNNIMSLGFGKLKGVFFKEVHTLSKQEFREFLSKYSIDDMDVEEL